MVWIEQWGTWDRWADELYCEKFVTIASLQHETSCELTFPRRN